MVCSGHIVIHTDRQTDVTENMTFPQTLYAGGNEMSKINEWSQYRIPLKQSSPPKQALLASATNEFFTVCTKLAEMAILYSKDLTTAKKCYLQWGST